jgi:branched-chain amino acid transport system ATP-binding protein
MTAVGAFLSVESLVTGYHQMEIVHGVSMSVQRGEIVVVIGPNGSGKSTLLKAVSGLLRTWSGVVRLGGRSLEGLSPRQRLIAGIGYVPQSANVFATMSVLENLRMGALVASDNYDGHLNRVLSVFPLLNDMRSVMAGRLSGGQQQMVALGRALMAGPSILLLDEPTAGLAPKLVGELFASVRRIAEQGVSALVVEQNAMSALAVADRAYVLANGENRLEGPAQKILDDPAVRQLYLGGSTINYAAAQTRSPP